MFSDVIKKEREKRGMSQDEFADYLQISRSSLAMYESGKRTPRDNILKSIAKALNITLDYLLDFNNNDLNNTTNIFKIAARKIPVVGSIRAGIPVLAEENIEGYEFANVPEGDNYIYLRVNGDSMINAGICTGDFVLIKLQCCAENGQIVACLVNGDEATLKRFHYQNDVVVLQPENTKYQPIIVPCKDFENGYARIIGVATQVMRHL